jgi:hypothetical protein
MRHEIRLAPHFGSGDVLASARHVHVPHESEYARQSASLLQAVNVASPGLAVEGPESAAAAAATASGEIEGKDGSPIATGAALGAAEATGEGSRSLRLQAQAKKVETAIEPAIDAVPNFESTPDR